MKRANNILAFTLAITLLSMVSAGQKPVGTNDKKLSAFDVKVNVMVLDAAGAYFNAVNADDLKLFEDDVEQKISSFARRELKLDLILVVDNSGSLRTELNRITTAVGTVVVNLSPKDEAAIVRFVSSDKIEVVQEWTSDQTKLLATVKDALYTEGGQSAVIDAVYLAIEKLKERKGPSEKVILLFSDGEDRESYYSRKDLFKLLEGTDIRIFTIALTGNIPQNPGYIVRRNNQEVAEDLVKRLAFASHGVAYILDKKIDEGMTSALRSLMIELRAQYVVGYTPSNPKRGTTRKLRIEVAPAANGEKRQAFTRESVHVPKD